MKKGFTLIELLIVVAIIAILAAIAVPNFLEAQVRSKVSRVKADMRSIATALEAYAVDNNRVPCDDWEFGKLPRYRGGELAVYAQITTPISYMTSIPKDPFIEKGSIDKGGVLKMDRKYIQYTTSFAVRDQDRADRSGARGRNYTWMLHSPGPTHNETRPADPSMRMQATSICAGSQGLWIYDATNGTVSHGMIIRTNKGFFDGGEYKAR